jgi:hypothetical protein
MNLEDQLDELRTHLLRDVSDLTPGGVDDRLFSDERLISYIKDAEFRFARKTLALRDATTVAATQVTLADDTQDYALHSSVLAVISAKYESEVNDLVRTGHAVVKGVTTPEFLTFDPMLGGELPNDKPVAFWTDETVVFGGVNAVTLSVYPKPSADEAGNTIYLRVARLPMTTYSEFSMSRESEIPEDYQLDVLEWAAYRAKRGFDADEGNQTDADNHKLAFEQAVLEATREFKRKTFAPAQIRYGGNGFTWSR